VACREMIDMTGANYYAQFPRVLIALTMINKTFYEEGVSVKLGS
jgi:hypothetical protein